MPLLEKSLNPWLKWLLLFGLWTLVGLAFAGQAYLSREKAGIPAPWSFVLGRALADWYVYALLSVPTLWLARRFSFERGRWTSAVGIHLMASAIFSLGYMALRALVAQWQTRGEMEPATFSTAFSNAFVATFFFNLLIYWVIILAQHAFRYYDELRERKRHTAQLETRLTQARLQALQMQLNPHFLFNTLNAISALVHKDANAADRMIGQLSDLLRYTLESTDAQEVPLRQELDFLDRYLEIQQARFGERLAVRREIEPETLEARVPNLVLQPLVENAIEHGIGPHARRGEIVLRAKRHQSQLELQVQDNGAGLPKHAALQESVGLGNTRARLQQLYGQAQQLELQNGSEGGLTVRITIPWRAGPNSTQG
jgi:two-component sensor histidine kinase